MLKEVKNPNNTTHKINSERSPYETFVHASSFRQYRHRHPPRTFYITRTSPALVA
jgi:hypothetical protein